MFFSYYIFCHLLNELISPQTNWGKKGFIPEAVHLFREGKENQKPFVSREDSFWSLSLFLTCHFFVNMSCEQCEFSQETIIILEKHNERTSVKVAQLDGQQFY